MNILKTCLHLSALSGVLFFTGCAFNPQSVSFNRNLPVTGSSLGEGKTVSVKVVDERTDLALGHRGTAYGKAASITTSDKMDQVVQEKFEEGLKQVGFVVNRDGTADRKIQVELRMLFYGTSTGFWTGGIETKGAVKIRASFGGETFERNYHADAEERVVVVPTADRNAELLNAILDQTLLKVFADQEFLAFIKR